MKIILETELERYAWGVMVAAHYKWEKNHGDSLRGQMDWYFNDLFKEETDEGIKKEVERRLRDQFGEEFFTTEDEYVKSGFEKLGEYVYVDWTDEERQEHEQDLRKEYRETQEDISEQREYMPVDVKDDLVSVYYRFFNAPEKLTVIFNGEVIQGVTEE